MNYMASMIEKIRVERYEKLESAILGEIKQMATEEGIETKILLNKKNIIDALRRQIPQKVNISLKGTTDWNTKCHCPACHKDLFDGQKYCSYCGQLIDWGNGFNFQTEAEKSKAEDHEFFTPEEVRKMSQAEVRQNYAKIINSMSKWHEEHG